MKNHRRPSICLTCISIAICLLLSCMVLSACSRNNDDPVPVGTTPLFPDGADTSSQNTPPQNNQPNTEQPNTPPAETVNVGNSSADPNESRGLTFTSNGNGTCTLTGLGTCSDVCLVIPTQSPSGERVTAIGTKAFYGNATISAIFLPSSVTSIGSMAFSAMPSLAYLSVDPGNPSFRADGGVLYSKDGATLVVYPAAKSATILSLSSSVRTISEMAFYGCSNLKGIAYEGSPADWQQITIASGNNSLFGLNVQYNSAMGK